jgi:SAM-dependent methyltransferase
MSKDLGTVYKRENFAQMFRDAEKEDLFHIYLDKPAMHSLLQNLSGKRVLCLGCGSGEECDYIRSKGAAEVVGIDLSKAMIEYAKRNFEGIDFRVMPLDKLSFPRKKFDVVYADMSVHYANSMNKLMENVSRLLSRNGIFIFSTSHPILDILVRDPEKGNRNGQHSKLFGYIKKNDKYIMKGDYFSKRVMHTHWFDGKYTVRFHYVPLSEIFEGAKAAGFVLDTLLEPKAPKSMKKVNPEVYERDSKVPMVILFKFIKT